MPEVGRPNILLMPHDPGSGLGRQVTRAVVPFRTRPFSATSVYITGVTRDSVGAALGGCVVDLFRSTDDAWIATVVSDGSGNYSFAPTVGGPFYIVAYKVGAPDVAGVTVNTLLPVGS